MSTSESTSESSSQSEPRPTGPPAGLPAGFPPSPGTLDRALGVVSYLRTHCAWDRAQTAESLVPYLLEEADEVAEAVIEGTPRELCSELGDLLLNVAFQVVVAEEAGDFDRDAVIQGLEAKMVRRHPHLFGDGVPEAWESIKARERHEAARGTDARKEEKEEEEALAWAWALQKEAAETGFDWSEPAGALAKTREEVDEVESALKGGDPAALREEIGDLLFSVVNVARLAGVDPGEALREANLKFQRRFRGVQRRARERGIPMPGATLEALDGLWDEVKAEERGQGSA